MSQRAQLKHVLLDVDFFGNPKIRALSRKHGLNGTLALIEIYCCMSRATNAVIDSDALLCVAEDNGIEDPEAFLKYSLDNGLICREGSGYSNSRVIKDQESLQAKRDKERNRQQKYRESRVTHAGEHMSPDPVSVTDTEDLKKNGEPEPAADFMTPLELEANKYLEPVNSKIVQESSVFMSSGRRPLKKFPRLWLTLSELAGTIEHYQNVGIPPDWYKHAFTQADLQATQEIQKGRPAERLPAAKWLQSFVATTTLEAIKAARDAKRSELYLEKAIK